MKPLSADRPVATVTNYVAAGPLTFPTPRFETIPAARWQEAYAKFSAALVDEAEKCHLDSVSLSNCFKAILTSPEGRGAALLPVAVYGATQDGEKTWIIEVLCGSTDPRLSLYPMSSKWTYGFTQNGIKQVYFCQSR